MAPRNSLEVFLARLAIVVGVLHGLGEAIWEWFYDQSVPMLLVDYIAVALLLYAGLTFLRRPRTAAAGLLAGAWGFTACLVYRVLFSRLDDLRARGGRTGEPDWFLVLLGVELLVVGGAFAASMYGLHRRRDAA